MCPCLKYLRQLQHQVPRERCRAEAVAHTEGELEGAETEFEDGALRGLVRERGVCVGDDGAEEVGERAGGGAAGGEEGGTGGEEHAVVVGEVGVVGCEGAPGGGTWGEGGRGKEEGGREG